MRPHLLLVFLCMEDGGGGARAPAVDARIPEILPKFSCQYFACYVSTLSS